MMQWNRLYNNTRTGKKKFVNSSTGLNRNSFQRDYDRIIFSSAFRRLQNKTQVFPLPGTVFVHNRLTHSLEVASVGRSLASSIGQRIAGKYAEEPEGFRDFYKYEFSSVIGAACLAHDIGNPPFGHSGEDAIRYFFENLPAYEKGIFESKLSTNQQLDFLKFEGNANAIRTLTHAFGENEPGGYKLTYATLASIVKYPTDSTSGFNKSSLHTKKSGFFDSDIIVWKDIADTLGIPKLSEDKNIYARHPFVYIVEAADDICYRIIDLEDAHRLGIISLEGITELYMDMFDGQHRYFNISNIKEQYERINDDNNKIQYLRAMLIGLLVENISNVFMNNEEALLQGKLNDSLLDLLPAHQLKAIKQIDDWSVKYLYNHTSIVEIEVAGYKVIGELLKTFTGVIFHESNPLNKKLLKLIPAQFIIDYNEQSFYENLMSIVDYITSMTDLYAVDLYKKINGMNLITNV